MNYILTTKTESELCHYGVKGMKWGKRKAQYLSDKQAAKSRYKKALLDAEGRMDARSDKNFNSNPGRTNSGFIKGKENRKAFRDAEESNIRQYKKDAVSAKAQYKADIKKAKNVMNSDIKSAVKKYSKSFDTASMLQDKADAKWSEAKALYKELGSNKISRMINASKGTSEAAKKYSKAYDQAERMSETADKKWRETMELRKKTGRNGISRTINNIRFG